MSDEAGVKVLRSHLDRIDRDFRIHPELFGYRPRRFGMMFRHHAALAENKQWVATYGATAGYLLETVLGLVENAGALDREPGIRVGALQGPPYFRRG